MKNKLLFITFFICSQITTQAQFTNYSVNLIPVSLKKGAVASVRFHQTNVQIKNIEGYTVGIKTVVTVFNSAGEKYAAFMADYDKNSKVKFLGGKVYNKYGSTIKYITKKEVRDYSAISDFSLYEDNRVKYIPPPSSDFPYTVEYEYRITKKGTFFITDWRPVPGYNVSVCKSAYTLKFRSKLPIKWLENNFDGNFEKQGLKNDSLLSWKLKNRPASKHEDLSMNKEEYLPSVSVSLNQFKFEKTKPGM